MTLIAVPPVKGQNTLASTPRATGNSAGDQLMQNRWLAQLYDLWAETVQVEGNLANHTARITNIEAEISGSTPVLTFNSRPGPAITLTSGDVTTALGFTPGPAYTLPTASTVTLGGVKVDGTSVTIAAGVISASGSAYTLPAARRRSAAGCARTGRPSRSPAT